MKAAYLAVALLSLLVTGCGDSITPPRRYDRVILLSEPDAQQRIDSLTRRRWVVVEDNELQNRLDAIFLWKHMTPTEAEMESE